MHEAIKQGHNVSAFNRRQTGGALPDQVNVIIGYMDDDVAYDKLGTLKFDKARLNVKLY